MKIKSMFYTLLFSTAAFTFLTNCTETKKEDHADHKAANHNSDHDAGSASIDEAQAPQFEVDAAFQNQLANVFTSYVTLKDAFVASDATQVAAKAKETEDALSKADMKLLTSAAHNDWMNYLASIQSSLKEIQEKTDIEEQRKAFSDLSDHLYKSIKAFGLGGKEAFYEYCPMAFNNEGGYWLSDQEQIRNPYFGDKMLTCGQVMAKLK